MKKFSLFLALVMLFSALAVYGAGERVYNDIKIVIDGAYLAPVDVNGNAAEPFIIDGTTYLPVRAISGALGISVDWDGATRTVYLGTRGGEVTKGNEVNIVIDGKIFTAKDATGKVVYPVIVDGSTFLPVRAIAEAFGKDVEWDGAAKTVIITTPFAFSGVEEGKTYKIISRGTNKALSIADGSASGASLVALDYTGGENQLWQFSDAGDGYYNIVNVQSGCACDVNGQSKDAGATVLQYTLGSGDNQKFRIAASEGGFCKIYAKHSELPFENEGGEIKQNKDRASSVQQWEISEAAAVKSESAVLLRSITLDDGTTFEATDENAVKIAKYNGSDAQKWQLIVNSEGSYTVTVKAGDRSLDVANESKTDGDPVIVYKNTGGENQNWILEKQQSGKYLIKSAHSGLYLSIENGTLVQKALGAQNQLWTLTTVK